MHRLIRWLGRFSCRFILALAIVLVSSATARAQFPMYGGGYGFPGFGYGYGYPGWGYGYPGFGYGYGYPMGGYGYGGYGFPGGYGYMYPGIGYLSAYNNPGFYSPGLMNPLFGVGMTPLGVRSYMIETQLLGRRSTR